MKPVAILSPFFLWAFVAYSQPAQKLPPHTKVLFFGDSHTSYGYGVKDNSVQYQNNGYVAWVNALAPGIQIPKGGILGVPGETTVQMVKRLQPVTASDAKVLVVMAGTNDVLVAVPPDTVKAKLRTIYNAGLSSGKRVIAITILPQYNPPSYHQIVEDFRQEVNAWIRAQTDVTIIDPETDLKAASNYEDGRHLTPAGTLVLGQKVAAVLNSWVQACLPGSGDAAQLSVAGGANPLMTGTGGTRSAAFGTVATNWDLSGSLAGGALVNGSKESSGSGERQVISLSGNYSRNDSRVIMSNNAAAPIHLQAGDVVEGVAEVEILPAMQNIRSVYLKVTAVNSNYQQVLGEGNSLFATSTSPVSPPAGKFLLRTPPITIGAGDPVAYLATQLIIEFNNTSLAAPVEATLKVSSAGIRRLPLSNGPLVTITPATQQEACPADPVLLQAGPAQGVAYQWTANGADLPGKNAATLQVTEEGQYSVRVTATGCAVLSEAVTVIAGCGCTQPYQFVGNGLWSNPSNWIDGRVPPSTLPSCAEIVINPAPGGECVVDAAVYLKNGTKLKVMQGKQMRIK